MKKDVFLLCVCVLILAGAGGYHYYQNAKTKPSADAITAAKGLLAAKPAGKVAPSAAADADLKKQAAANQAARAPIEAALQSMKVSSILLGDPAIVIINKKEYSVGDALPLPGGKALPVTAIQEDGVSLAANGQTFHLAAPTVPDLDISRKAR